jgi:hypothetical protein
MRPGLAGCRDEMGMRFSRGRHSAGPGGGVGVGARVASAQAFKARYGPPHNHAKTMDWSFISILAEAVQQARMALPMS